MKTFLLLAVICLTQNAFGQSITTAAIPKQSFFAEVGGPGIIFSLNYDTRFKQSPLGLGGRLGVGFTTGDRNRLYDSTGGYYYGYYGRRRSVLTIPAQVNYLFGKPNSTSAFEIGFGATYIGKNGNSVDSYDVDISKARVIGNASFMYRRLPKNGGFSWRVGFTPVLENGYIAPSAAASVGFNF